MKAIEAHLGMDIRETTVMKNNFGYADKQEVVLTPNNPLGDTKDTKELEERYIESVVEDD